MNKCGALLTNLSQTFDYLLQNFLITKLHAYGFDRGSLRMIHSYPVDRKEPANIDNKVAYGKKYFLG